MGSQAQDDVDAAAGFVGRQIADLDNAPAMNRMTGQTGDCFLDRGVEIAFQEQPFVTGATPAGGGDGAPLPFEQQQIGGENREPGPVTPGESLADEAFSFLAARRAGHRMVDRRLRPLSMQDIAAGAWHGSLSGNDRVPSLGRKT